MKWETKTVNVIAPARDRTIRHNQAFGWILTESERYYDGGVYYRLNFIRDKTMPNWEKIYELETEYLCVDYPPDPGKSVFLILGIIALVISCNLFFLPLFFHILAIIGSVALIVLGIVRTIANKKKYKEEFSRVQKIKFDALSAARNLL